MNDAPIPPFPSVDVPIERVRGGCAPRKLRSRRRRTWSDAACHQPPDARTGKAAWYRTIHPRTPDHSVECRGKSLRTANLPRDATIIERCRRCPERTRGLPPPYPHHPAIPTRLTRPAPTETQTPP